MNTLKHFPKYFRYISKAISLQKYLILLSVGIVPELLSGRFFFFFQNLSPFDFTGTCVAHTHSHLLHKATEKLSKTTIYDF